MSVPLPWSARDQHPTQDSIVAAIREGDGLIWPNNEARTATAAYVDDAGRWTYALVGPGLERMVRNCGSALELIGDMEKLAPIWQWQRRKPGCKHMVRVIGGE